MKLIYQLIYHYPENISMLFRHCLLVDMMRDVGQSQTTVETKLCISTLEFTTLNNVESLFFK